MPAVFVGVGITRDGTPLGKPPVKAAYVVAGVEAGDSVHVSLLEVAVGFVVGLL